MRRALASVVLVAALVGLAGVPLAGSVYYPPAGGGSSSVEVIPDYLAIDGEATIDPADWVSADTIGGPHSVDKEALGGGTILALALNRDSAGAPITGSRTQGLLTAIGAGDFVVGMRLELTTTTDASSPLGSRPNCGGVFVDGADASADDWYGYSPEWNMVSIATGPTAYWMSNTSGTPNTYESYGGGEFASLPNLMGPYDTSMSMWLQRSGVTLKLYVSKVSGSIPMFLKSWTVSAGAGYVGPRCQIRGLVSEDTMSLQLVKYRYQASAVLPWLP